MQEFDAIQLMLKEQEESETKASEAKSTPEE